MKLNEIRDNPGARTSSISLRVWSVDHGCAGVPSAAARHTAFTISPTDSGPRR